MSFTKYTFIEITHDNTSNTCKVELEVDDTVLGLYTANVTIGADLLTDDNDVAISAADRDIAIKAECKRQIANHYDVLAANAIADAVVPDTTTITPFADGTTLL